MQKGCLMREDIKKEEVKYKHIELLLKLLVRIFAPVALMFGGLALLALRISGWSMVFGLPMVVIGVVFMIYAYDEILSRKSGGHTHEEDGFTDQQED